jgi:methylenetetrahydrofolate dehydrogenase (NADP+) / methenyltetrahydrofolate cyclohydrolase
MSAKSLDGLAVASAIKGELRSRVEILHKHDRWPGLGTLLVGDDPGSHAYVKAKHRDCVDVGIGSRSVELPDTASSADVAAAIQDLNEDPAVTAFIVQLPLPDGINETEMLERIDPRKDADGLHPTNLGHLVLGSAGKIVPCTPAGIVELLRRHDISIAGQRIAVIGRGLTVGRPLSLLLSARGHDATVTSIHSQTRNAAVEASRADIVVAAAGAPHMVTPSWVRPGAVVVDVGVTRIGTTDAGRARLAGDVHPDVAGIASWLSPNPGGVGPMTRAMLLANVVAVAEHEERKL